MTFSKINLDKLNLVFKILFPIFTFQPSFLKKKYTHKTIQKCTALKNRLKNALCTDIWRQWDHVVK